jgi:hypothetical protein
VPPPPWRQERPLPRSLAQEGPRGVEVLLGALGPGTQLTARLLEHLRAGFHRGAQLIALAGRVGAQLLEVGGVSPARRATPATSR